MNGLELSPIELASGLVFGSGRIPSAAASVPADPRVRLEELLAAALRQAPCVLSYSGGRDSSCVLALATALARREGLPLPIPATCRFPHADATKESQWQEQVMAHLGLEDWVKLSFEDELSAVGPVAARVLDRHGLLWPFNAHFHVPLLELARGGCLVTGIGGDELFGPSRWERAYAILGGRIRPRRTDARAIGFLLAPRALRRPALRSRPPRRFPWLTERGYTTLVAAWAAQGAEEPRTFLGRVRWWHALRSTELGFAALDALASDANAAIAHPLADQTFGEALARSLPTELRGDRDATTAWVFGELLPAAVVERPTKAVFDEIFWGTPARDFVREWGGEGVDEEVVDVAALQQEWATPVPDPHTLTLLQSVWLRGRASAAAPPLRSPTPTPAVA